MNRPAVDPALEKRLDGLLKQASAARRAGDLPGAIVLLEQAWDLLPEPKLSWDYYGQGLSRRLTESCLEVGDLTAAARWCAEFDAAYSPHSETSRMMVDFEKAKLLYRTGELDAAHALFSAVYQVKGKRAFADQDPAYYDFYRNHQPTPTAAPASAVAGWAIRIPEPGTGEAGPASGELDAGTRERIEALLAEGDNYLDLDAPQAAAEQYVAVLDLLPTPRAQWTQAETAYTSLAEACRQLTQDAEADRATRYAETCRAYAG